MTIYSLCYRINLKNGGIAMKFRKKDYVIFYAVLVLVFVLNLMSPLKFQHIISILIGAVLPALILGTISNLLIRRR